jgi:hypothetical protein
MAARLLHLFDGPYVHIAGHQLEAASTKQTGGIQAHVSEEGPAAHGCGVQPRLRGLLSTQVHAERCDLGHSSSAGTAGRHDADRGKVHLPLLALVCSIRRFALLPFSAYLSPIPSLPPVLCSMISAVCCPVLSAVYCLLSAIGCLLSAVNCLLSSVC